SVPFSASAQKYFVYDNEAFSVLVTCNDENTEITSIEYTMNMEWVAFSILNRKVVQDTDDGEGGYVYKVKDTNGNNFVINYYRTSDYMHVINSSTQATWKLTRRPDDKM
ncbi:MAG: hypothetical protein V2A54_14490, partial [Bacteroidota bacterium]